MKPTGESSTTGSSFQSSSIYYPHTIRVTSHSKDLSLPGERIGYIAVSPYCEEIDELISAHRLCQSDPRVRQCPGIDAEIGRPSPEEIR